jgi:hypothetical protein
MKCAHCSKSVFFLAYKLDNGSTLCPSCYAKIKDSLPKTSVPPVVRLLSVLSIICFLSGMFIVGAGLSNERLIIIVVLSLTGTGLLLVGQKIAKKK